MAYVKVRRYDNDKWIVSKLVDTYPPPTTYIVSHEVDLDMYDLS